MTAADTPPMVDRTAPVEALAAWIVAEHGRPVDRWAVAALLESIGLRDIDARDVYGMADVFALAALVHRRALTLEPPPSKEPPGPSGPWHRRAGRLVTMYVRGSFVGLPMAVQVLAMLVLGFALWSYLRFDETEASAVSVGTIASFVITGGFVQTIGRLGLSYAADGAHRLAEEACRRLVVAGTVAMLVAGLIGFVVNLLTGWFPQWVMALALAYYVLLSILWLLLAVLYTVEHRLGVLATIAFGIGAIWALRTFTPANIYIAHWFGLALAAAMAGTWGWVVLRRRSATVGPEQWDLSLPRLSILVYSVAPYFLYGTLYFSLLFLDRVVAWSTGDFRLPLLIWFRTPYELGLDWALITLVLSIALLEYSVHSFARRFIAVQQRSNGLDRAAHNDHYVRFYRRQLLLLAITVFVSVVVTYRVVLLADDHRDLEQARDFFGSPVTFQVFAFGAVAYGLLALALLNVSYFFTLSRPWLALRPLVTAMAVGLVVGFVLSRVVEDWWAVLGLLASTATFAVLTARHALRFMRSMDHVYVSAA